MVWKEILTATKIGEEGSNADFMNFENLSDKFGIS